MLDTILFDLDGTLLHMEQDAFIPAYVKQLCTPIRWPPAE